MYLTELRYCREDFQPRLKDEASFLFIAATFSQFQTNSLHGWLYQSDKQLRHSEHLPTVLTFLLCKPAGVKPQLLGQIWHLGKPSLSCMVLVVMHYCRLSFKPNLSESHTEQLLALPITPVGFAPQFWGRCGCLLRLSEEVGSKGNKQ